MKPCSRKVLKCGNLMQRIGFGSQNTIAKITGKVQKLSQNYQDAVIVLYSKSNLYPLAITKPNENGEYIFAGLNNSIACFIVAFDESKQYNAVIQDSVVPK